MRTINVARIVLDTRRDYQAFLEALKVGVYNSHAFYHEDRRYRSAIGSTKQSDLPMRYSVVNKAVIAHGRPLSDHDLFILSVANVVSLNYTSYYKESVRMRGSLDQVGMDFKTLEMTAAHLVSEFIDMVMSSNSEVIDHAMVYAAMMEFVFGCIYSINEHFGYNEEVPSMLVVGHCDGDVIVAI